MNALLGGLGRLVGLRLVLRMTAGLPRRAARALLLATVLVVNVAPAVAVLTGAVGYGDVWLWLAVEVVTIYVWTLARALATREPGGPALGVAFFGVHYGMFALVPFLLGALLVLPAAPLRSPLLTVLVLGGLGFLAVGWSVAGAVVAGRRPSVGDYVRAYARMFLAYAALLLPLVAGTKDGTLLPLTDSRQRLLALVVLLAKLALELVLVVGIERRPDGRTYLLGRPIVVSTRRSS
ncbi:hypothetical protein H9L10_12525 [Phycicoccus endophyticus]|uniref:Uncharacterized protein n=1 Tax=Phycicoccus endophyticus TaxID=1690220 RepID=A0A7G9R0C9_9MICO|nr:DUF6498-containing protein [Phycicoccus endophyticus]NHI20133.1 hypothetical protein [Phycicoccus endophyticus]QNN49054.1 hypothetical protein H9L10_12525 [Phycicoccus endophyticus]GGL38128.1 hypothetical protein GCM10012283_20900 [Phycicoccus endophyticus]